MALEDMRVTGRSDISIVRVYYKYNIYKDNYLIN